MCLQNYTIKLFQENLSNLSVSSDSYKNKNEQKYIKCQCTLCQWEMGKGKSISPLFPNTLPLIGHSVTRSPLIGSHMSGQYV